MAARVKRLSEQFGGGVSWDSIPTLEALYAEMTEGGSEESRRNYFDAIVIACSQEQAKVLAIELTILDRSFSLDDRMNFRSCFYHLDTPLIGLIAARLKNAGSLPSSQSPYEASMLQMPGKGRHDTSGGQAFESSPYQKAMSYMLDYCPPGAAIPEPIVSHPGLRHPDLLYIVSDPAKTECAPVPASDTYKIENLDPAEPNLLNETVSTVEEQVSVFHQVLLKESQRMLNWIGADNRRSPIENPFEYATLLVVPFIRDTYERSARDQLMGDADRDVVEREGASGLVAFIWAMPEAEHLNPKYGDRIATRILELHRVLLVKDSIRKSTLLAQKSQFVQDAAHGIANQIATLQLKEITSIFYQARRENAPRISRYKLVKGRPEPGDPNFSKIEQYDESIDFINELVSNYIAVIELGTGPGYARDKFQTKRQYSLQSTLDKAVRAANSWRPRKFPQLRCRVACEVTLAGFPYNEGVAAAIVFPLGYLKSGIIESQLVESFMNARKHGEPDADGEVVVEVTIQYDDARELPLQVILANRSAGRLSKSSSKMSPLNFVPGLKVSSSVTSEIDHDLYHISYEFGAIFYEIKQTGIKEIAYPGIISASGVQGEVRDGRRQ